MSALDLGTEQELDGSLRKGVKTQMESRRQGAVPAWVPTRVAGIAMVVAPGLGTGSAFPPPSAPIRMEEGGSLAAALIQPTERRSITRRSGTTSHRHPQVQPSPVVDPAWRVRAPKSAPNSDEWMSRFHPGPTSPQAAPNRTVQEAGVRASGGVSCISSSRSPATTKPNGSGFYLLIPKIPSAKVQLSMILICRISPDLAVPEIDVHPAGTPN